ncbi:GH36-type glycosyl hydrolase domain-containing protein [Niveibacterium terrae]|uniref:GH36-type glycosyl hydrolase domain-containing protein n=1 Tax=Niveibacterium terrae TaxID=3373598 RepID=UPI003A8DE22B
MKYGYFDDEAREYVITNPRTPVKWINYVGGLAFGGFVDQTGGALICKGDPALNRILKYLPQAPASDFKGETLYLRTHEAEGLRVFSPYFVPTLDALDRFECHVGLGYSRWISEFHGIRAEITVFVPIGEARLVRDIRITNLRATAVEIDAIPVVEYTHFDALKQFTNADWVPQTMQSEARREADGRLVLNQCAFMKRDSARNYFTSNLPVSSFESDRRRFLGDNEYGTWRAPLSLQAPELSNYEAKRGDNIGALLHHLGELAPGESRRLITQLGQCADLAAEAPAIQRFRDPATVDRAFAALAKHWRDYLAVLEVKTPDPAFDAMVNVHNPRQCAMTLNWSRDLSLYQLGFGGRGLGFRDSSQDTMGAVAHDPIGVRALLRKLLQVQKRDGSAMHQFMPSTMEASTGDSREFPDRPKYYGDDHLWVVLAVAALLRETGDLAFLDEVLPFYDASEDGLREEATVLEHLRRAIDFTWSHRGTHGLPLLGFADWNDTVNLRAGAESNFIAPQYGKALREMIEIAEVRGDEASKAQYLSRFAEIKAAVERETWDGAWYVRYFDHEGRPLGSHTNAHGKIYINAQSWNVIAGFAEGERAHTALDSVHEHLATANGLKLSAPGFDHYDPELGGISTYPPGAKENGGIFLHTNPWVMIAETMLGNGERAFQYYRAINPAAKNDRLDEFESEPYCYPQNMLGDEHPQFGLARNSWLSGTASWTYQAATQYMLGLRPSLKGLLVDPCIPKDWPGFSATRRFRGATYAIEVRNLGSGHGVRTMHVDGHLVPGNLIPAFASGEHVVEVEIG